MFRESETARNAPIVSWAVPPPMSHTFLMRSSRRFDAHCFANRRESHCPNAVAWPVGGSACSGPFWKTLLAFVTSAAQPWRETSGPLLPERKCRAYLRLLSSAAHRAAAAESLCELQGAGRELLFEAILPALSGAESAPGLERGHSFPGTALRPGH